LSGQEKVDSSPPVVLITGGSSGIGLATALQFYAAGYRVAICGRDAFRLRTALATLDSSLPSPEGVERRPHGSPLINTAGSTAPSLVRSELGGYALGRRVLGGVCDLGQTAQILGFANQVLDTWGQVDVLLNNAAVAPLAPFAETDAAAFEAVVATNLRGPWELTQALWPAMVARRRGVVVNVSSLAAIDPFSGFSLYGASKAWLETWTKALATEGEPLGIRVVGVRPGAVETPLLRQLFPDFPAEQCVSAAEVAATIFELATNSEVPAGTIRTVAKQTASGSAANGD
jgi:NAD(P)-dependent dehydrogenase (short-subunit alcohol dehydrogenase family)